MRQHLVIAAILGAAAAAACNDSDPVDLPATSEHPLTSAPVVTFKQGTAASAVALDATVSGPSKTLVTLYAGPDCSGATLGAKVTNHKGVASFSGVPVA